MNERVAGIRKHVEDRFEAGRVEHFPFPHMIVKDFFPEEVHADILRLNPYRSTPGREWISRAESRHLKTGTPYHARKQIELGGSDPVPGDAETAALWKDIADCFLQDHWFERLVYDKWQDYWTIRFGELVRDPDFFALLRRELFLQRHEPGYAIGPHTDVPTRVFTCIFSFAETPGFEPYGTQLLEHRDPRVRCWGNDHYAADEFTVREVAPYAPNGFLLFFKTRQSFHAVREIDETVPNQRYGMQFQLYEPGAGLFRDLSEPDLMRMRHRRSGGPMRRLWRKLATRSDRP